MNRYEETEKTWIQRPKSRRGEGWTVFQFHCFIREVEPVRWDCERRFIVSRETLTLYDAWVCQACIQPSAFLQWQWRLLWGHSEKVALELWQICTNQCMYRSEAEVQTLQCNIYRYTIPVHNVDTYVGHIHTYIPCCLGKVESTLCVERVAEKRGDSCNSL